MASTLVIEDGTGVSDADSVATLAEANTRFASQRGAASNYTNDWEVLTDADQDASLRLAWEVICQQIEWDGYPVNEDTEHYLDWPRTGVYDKNGNEIPDDVIPKNIKIAQIEMALAIVRDISRLDDQEVGLSSFSAGPVSLSFDKFDRTKVLPPIVRSLLSQYGTLRASGSRETTRA